MVMGELIFRGNKKAGAKFELNPGFNDSSSNITGR
jgi:hypothetical protein